MEANHLGTMSFRQAIDYRKWKMRVPLHQADLIKKNVILSWRQWLGLPAVNYKVTTNLRTEMESSPERVHCIL